jgi:FKBP-type peptidyl-prolyl cis-trans isomerase
LTACENGSTGEGVSLPLSSEIDSVSYAYGLSVSESLNKIEEDLGDGNGMDVNLFTNGVREGVAGNPRFTSEQIQAVLAAFGQKMQVAGQKKQQEEGLKNTAIGEEYLEKNKANEGVQVTPSGLQYKVIQEGTGAKPTLEDKVTVHYTGKLIDGTVFDSSVQRGQPISFAVTGVIKGWTEGLQLMKEGAKYEFYIPSGLAYGPQGNQGIPPNSVLFFEVELIKIGE